MVQRVPVLIVGGGLAGLSMAAFLSWQGVPCLLVERHTGLSIHPRARGINPRAMELMRGIGLEPAIRGTESAAALVANSGVVAAESLTGRELGALQERYFMDVHADLSAVSPTGWCLCHQDEFEPLIADRAAALGAELRFHTELESFAQDDDGVTAELRDRATGETSTVRADYLVAADGPDSPIRRALGISFDGPGTLGCYLNISFAADLGAALGDRRFIMCYVFSQALRGALMPLDNAERWLLHVMFDPREQDPADFTADRCVELVRAATGIADLPVTIRGVMPWEAAGRTASGFSAGRVFIAGDAAHVMPPSGAFGSNTGIQDAHNLAWKLAAVLTGQAGPGLLDSYDAERRPVCAATVEQAVLRSKDRPRMVHQEPAPTNPAIVADPTVWFGWRYASAAVVPDAPDDSDSPVWAGVPVGLPGTRAPHIELERAGERLSTLDLFGRGLTLLAGPEDEAWSAAAAAVAERRQVGVTVARIGSAELTDVKDAWSEAYGIGVTGAVLVRPDGVVAWRATEAVEDPVASLDAAVAHVLSLTD